MTISSQSITPSLPRARKRTTRDFDDDNDDDNMSDKGNVGHGHEHYRLAKVICHGGRPTRTPLAEIQAQTLERLFAGARRAKPATAAAAEPEPVAKAKLASCPRCASNPVRSSGGACACCERVYCAACCSQSCARCQSTACVECTITLYDGSVGQETVCWVCART